MSATRTDDSYDARVAQILAELGIPAAYGVDRHMPSYAEARDLVSVGMDIYGRDRQLTPHAAGRWTELRVAAHRDGIALLLVSAFEAWSINGRFSSGRSELASRSSTF